MTGSPLSEKRETVMCTTMGHENQRATRFVSCEGDGSYPYCDECATLLIEGGELDGGATDDPVVAERDRLREALCNVRDELSNGPTANWDFIDRQWEALNA